MTTQYHIAQVNIARMVAPLDSFELRDFVARLVEINALADGSDGFVWRLQTDEGDATYLRPYDDDRILFNLSVWESVEQLREYVYKTAHVEVMKRRREWFDKFDGAYFALWWVKAGEIPSVEEAKRRIEYLQARGESRYAFSFKNAHDPDQECLTLPVEFQA